MQNSCIDRIIMTGSLPALSGIIMTGSPPGLSGIPDSLCSHSTCVQVCKRFLREMAQPSKQVCHSPPPRLHQLGLKELV